MSVSTLVTGAPAALTDRVVTVGDAARAALLPNIERKKTGRSFEQGNKLRRFDIITHPVDESLS